MVGCQDQAGVLPKIMFIEIVQQFTEIFVAHGDKGRVVAANLGNLAFGIGHLFVERPIQDLSVVAGIIGRPEPFGRNEGLVGVEALQLQEPVIRAPVQIQKLKCGSETLGGRKIGIVLQEIAIDRSPRPFPCRILRVAAG